MYCAFLRTMTKSTYLLYCMLLFAQQNSVPSGSSDLQTPVRTTFKCNLTPPPVFDRIDVDANIASWLRLVAKICRLAGYHRGDWSTFASTLLAEVPLSLFDAAEYQAETTGPAALADQSNVSGVGQLCSVVHR